METQTNQFSLQEAADFAGISYGRLWYALVTRRLPEPPRVGRTRVFTLEDVAVIRVYFANEIRETEHQNDEALNIYEESPQGQNIKSST